METNRFDRLTRNVATLLSRRALAAAFGLSTLVLPGMAEAKKKRRKKKHKKKVTFNDFGCVNVGGFCKNAAQCCSGICAGKKDKNLQKCQTHDSGGCPSGQKPCDNEEPCTTSAGEDGFCLTTTGRAGYCYSEARCFPCTKDADCIPVCGPQAACISCAGSTVCGSTGNTGCVGPVEGGCTVPV